jgi:hypothetical protein
MKHLILIITTAIILTACGSDIEDPIKVFNYDTNQSEIISKSSINSNDVVCIAKLGVLRDVLIDTLKATYKSSDLLRNSTSVQDDLLLKYPHTIPTSWIDSEKNSFIRTIPSDMSDVWLRSQYTQCGLSI